APGFNPIHIAVGNAYQAQHHQNRQWVGELPDQIGLTIARKGVEQRIGILADAWLHLGDTAGGKDLRDMRAYAGVGRWVVVGQRWPERVAAIDQDLARL